MFVNILWWHMVAPLHEISYRVNSDCSLNFDIALVFVFPFQQNSMHSQIIISISCFVFYKIHSGYYLKKCILSRKTCNYFVFIMNAKNRNNNKLWNLYFICLNLIKDSTRFTFISLDQAHCAQTKGDKFVLFRIPKKLLQTKVILGYGKMLIGWSPLYIIKINLKNHK